MDWFTESGIAIGWLAESGVTIGWLADSGVAIGWFTDTCAVAVGQSSPTNICLSR